MGMDELIIDEKKYVSSKRAAEITGYAKDYVGQLCRGGYVPAKRVGRNWYVLESAIKDHRFGSGVPLEPKSVISTSKPQEKRHAESAEPVHLSKRTFEQSYITEEVQKPLHGDFQEAWQAWFEMFRGRETSIAIPPMEEEVVGNQLGGEEVVVPDDAEPEELPSNLVESSEEQNIPLHVLPNDPPPLPPSKSATPRPSEATYRPSSPRGFRPAPIAQEKHGASRGIFLA